MLNTFVYNGLFHSVGLQARPLMDSATRCLHLMYERDCRHQFCPSFLWLSPARKSRPPIAVAARTHENILANLRPDDASTIPSMGSVITTTPHVFPFEERQENLFLHLLATLLGCILEYPNNFYILLVMTIDIIRVIYLL